MKSDYFALDLIDEQFVYLDQTKLPLEENYIRTTDYNRIALAIERLEIRGAPAIGIAAAYGLALALKDIPNDKIDLTFQKAYDRLASTRPTAVNLFYTLNELKSIYDSAGNSADTYNLLIERAKEIHNLDKISCEKIGKNGLRLFKFKSRIITHCNTGKLATGGDGTAFSIIKTGFEHGLVDFVYADETRPLLQGLRLTAFELDKNGILFEVLADSSAASLIKSGKVDFAVVGADRIVLNGDTANKIGTYNLAIVCNHHNIPFYVAAPETTIDRNTVHGDDIKIEHRNKSELIEINGNRVSQNNYQAYTPAFDVTPAHLITGIITDEDVYTFPYDFRK